MKGKRQTARNRKDQIRSNSRPRQRREETTFLFLGNKVMDELRILAHLASPKKSGQGEG